MCNYEITELKFDTEGLYSLTKPLQADYISDLIKTTFKYHFNKEDIIITDATAGVGGNSISFAEHFNKVNCVEINEYRFNCLKDNLKKFNLYNTVLYQDNFINLFFKLESDIIFIDPPWGGPNYKYKTNLRLKLSNIYLEDLCLMLKNTKMIVLKLPLNYHLDLLKKYFFLKIKKLKNMYIIFIIQK